MFVIPITVELKQIRYMWWRLDKVLKKCMYGLYKGKCKTEKKSYFKYLNYWYIFNNLLIPIYFIDLYRFYISQKLIDASSVRELKLKQ